MLDLLQLPAPPGCGEVTACECEGVLRANSPATAALMAQHMLGGGEPILQSESRETVRPALGKQDAQLAFNATPRLPASIALAFRERGLTGVLEQVCEGCNSRGGTAAAAVAVIATALLAGIRNAKAISTMLTPHASKFPGIERTISNRTQASSAGGSSTIVCIAWHGVSRRLAVGYTDDGVRIFSERPLQPLLKHRTQRGITQVHWLPYSMSVVCVACEAGVLLWSVDPSSVVTRPSGACITLLPSPYASPRLDTVMAPHPQGLHLAASSGGGGVCVWDVALVTGVRVQEAGTVTHLLYSPDGTQLLVVVLNPPKIRVFDTSDWSHVEWLCSSAVSCCAWSPCSQHVVFCSSEPCTLFAVSPQAAAATATALADLSAVQLTDQAGDTVVVGGSVQGLYWGGERLVILFQGCPFIALFRTSTLHTLKIAPGGVMKGPDECSPVTACFHPSQSSLLTVVWSDSSLQHVPLVYTSRQSTSGQRATPCYQPATASALNATLAYTTALGSPAASGSNGHVDSPVHRAGKNSLLYGAGNDSHVHGAGNDSRMYGTSNDSYIRSADNDSHIHGAANDSLTYGAYNDSALHGAGNSSNLYGAGNASNLYGSASPPHTTNVVSHAASGSGYTSPLLQQRQLFSGSSSAQSHVTSASLARC